MSGARSLVDVARERNRAFDGRAHPAGADGAGARGEAPRGEFAPVEDVPALPQAVRLLDAPDEEPPSWLVRDLIPKGEPVLVVGPDGSMKSTLALHLACAVAAGGRVFEHGALVDSAPVLVVSGEDPRGVVANRCAAIARGHGWNGDRVLGNLHVLALAGTDLTLTSWRTHLVAEVTRTGAALVILDPLADLASGDENDNTERRAVVATWRALAQTGATPLLVHHAGKAGDGGRSKRERIRGASAIAAAARCTFFVEQTEAGVTVENLKQSRAERVPAFVVATDISADPTNRAVWTSARFTRTTQRRAERSHAEAVILEVLAAHPGATSGGIRDAAKGVGVSTLALNDALQKLEGVGAVTFDAGPRGAKFWRATDLATAGPCSNRVDGTVSSDPVHPVPTLFGRVAEGAADPVHPVPPLGGRTGWNRGAAERPEQGDLPSDDAMYLADERAALEHEA